jgi:hypothetical protein
MRKSAERDNRTRETKKTCLHTNKSVSKIMCLLSTFAAVTGGGNGVADVAAGVDGGTACEVGGVDESLLGEVDVGIVVDGTV